MRRALVLAGLMLLAPLAGAAPASADVEGDAAERLTGHAVYVDPAVAKLVDADRLDYAARVTSRTADGARIKVAFVNVGAGRLAGLRDRLFARLKLGDDGAVVIATPLAVVLRSAALSPDQEAYILRADGRALRRTPRRYTSAVAELTYDVGLVIHNLRPDAVPRGLGRDSNLRTFSGRYPGESTGGVRPTPPRAVVTPPATAKDTGGDGNGVSTPLLVAALVLAGLGIGVAVGFRRPRRRG